jgi:hypothetical protein
MIAILPIRPSDRHSRAGSHRYPLWLGGISTDRSTSGRPPSIEVNLPCLSQRSGTSAGFVQVRGIFSRLANRHLCVRSTQSYSFTSIVSDSKSELPRRYAFNNQSLVSALRTQDCVRKLIVAAQGCWHPANISKPGFTLRLNPLATRRSCRQSDFASNVEPPRIKGEQQNPLRRAVFFNRLGEIRGRPPWLRSSAALYSVGDLANG